MANDDEELIQSENEHSTGNSQTETEPKSESEAEADHHESLVSAEDRNGRESSVTRVSIETSAEENQGPALPYPVVGFGASAGGLQALSAILEDLDPNTGMSFVIVTHLAPDQKSFLTEILERHTNMPVSSAEEGHVPEPNHLYVLLPNQSLTLKRGHFKVQQIAAGERFPRIIDNFFYSLAADQKNHAIGVVLSGADADGAAGLKSIKGEGGITLVQSPETAAQSSMPRSSIAADHVDLVVSPAEIAIELGRLGHQFTRPEVRSLREGKVSADDDQSYLKILLLLHEFSGLDFRQYKSQTVRRRIARRMLLLRVEQLAHYLRMIQVRPNELRLLQEDILINVTRFFRDEGFWESLRTNVLPVLMQDRSPDRQIRIWCAGCSSGEEAYSLAIAVFEYLSQSGFSTQVQIFGTDASEESIEVARAAVYPPTLANDISPERLRRYFVKVDRGYQVSKRVRDACIFAKQNLASDPPFSKIDILSCRNVLIYFDHALQLQVMLTLHYAIEPGGYLLLGLSEGLRDLGDAFSAVDRKHKIFMKTGSSVPFGFDAARPFAFAQLPRVANSQMAETETNLWSELELQRAADRIVLARFGPPGLIVDDRMNVLQSRGQISQFLEITPGVVTWNLRRVLPQHLVNDVQAAFQRAIHEDAPISTRVPIFDERNGESQIQVDVLPISSASARPRCFLILFQDIAKEEIQTTEQLAQPHLTPDEKDLLLAQLRQDQVSTRFHLQSLVEERDARNQELVSANEEIQSANEELQSTNEELETTKEELQSANEELQTLNDELQQRNNILTQTGNDLNNLLNSVNIPLLMLTSELHIRQFTPPMQKLVSVRPADIGRPVSDIKLHLSLDDIESILHDVLETLGTREVEVQDREGRWHLMRVRPYRTADNKIEGLVVLLLDVDQLRRSQQLLVDARDFANSVVESVPVPIVVVNQDLTVRTENTAFRQLTQFQVKSLAGRALPDIFLSAWGVDHISEKLQEIFAAPAGSTVEFEYQSASAPRKSLVAKGRALNTDGTRVLLLIVDDITLRRDAEVLQASQKEALEGEIEIAAYKLNRTQVELRGLTGHLFTVQEEERQRVARELHDDISQRLSVLEIMLHEIHVEDNKQQAKTKINDAREQLQSINTDVRLLSHRLHPSIISDLGISAALKALVSDFGQRENMPATFVSQNLPENLPSQTMIAIYRIAQEALRNIAKHAGKTHVKVILVGNGDSVQLKIADFGVGFDQDTEAQVQGLGMISMLERARLAGGTLSVTSELGEGTTVAAELPLEPHA